jgi:hypothetical protein
MFADRWLMPGSPPASGPPHFVTAGLFVARAQQQAVPVIGFLNNQP